ncbi:MAG: HPr family phosphocarrier protein [Tissierellia bacterium]|nr:HPr family phosphocarrier protein [Tissierellia bacterium]
MISKKVTLKKVGLNARPAALFVKEANKFSSNIYLECKGKKVNGKSIIGVILLGAFGGEELTIYANGIDEKKAVEALADLLENRMENCS